LTEWGKTNSISSPVSARTCVTLLVAFAVFAGGSVGTSNGLVLHIDGDGHLAVEAPHLRHAHDHADGADHAPHDHDSDADHGDLHRLIATCSDSFATAQKLDRSSADAVAALYVPVPFAFCPVRCPASGFQPPSATRGLGAPTFRRGTAHPDLASLRSVVLLS
jgi:hypothetical protein